MVQTLPVSRFAQRYNEHLSAAEATGDTIVLQQRGGRPAWVLEPQAQSESTVMAVGYLSGALSALLKDEVLANRFVDEFATTLPWIGFLPSEDRMAFVLEASEMLRACASVGRFVAFEQLVEDWRNTAEIWSDTALASALLAPVDDPLNTRVS